MSIIQSVKRSLQILDLFDEQTTELKVTEISERMGLHKSTTYSLIKTLLEFNYIEQNPENKKYRLGMKLVERGNLVINTIDLRHKSRSHLIDLAINTKQTSHLGVLDGKAAVYIDKEEGEKAIIRYSRIGRRIPLHSTAIGKVLLAYQKLEESERILADYEYVQVTANTIKNDEEFMEELERVRQQGYAVDNEENIKGIRCIAVPITNQNHEILGALSISTLITNVNDNQLNCFLQLLQQTGKSLSQQVQYLLPNK